MTSIREALQTASNQLKPYTETPVLEAEILLMLELQQPRSHLHAWPENSLNEATLNGFLELVQRRVQGEPIAHITKEKEFWSLPLKITADVLIPRPETELLVEIALLHIPQHTAFKIADLGTGSGAIAIALASERPQSKITATDTSSKALLVAKENAEAHDMENIQFIISDWCRELNDRDYDMIVSNPPYIAENDPYLQQGDLPHEPASALISGRNGLDDIQMIIDQARDYLKPGGMLLLEHGYDQSESVSGLLSSAGYSRISCHKDLAGIPRVTYATFMPQPA